jgi:endonuclease YncB( thermonuclease family)
MDNIIETTEELDKCNIDTIVFFNFKSQIHLARVVKCYDGDTIHCIFKCNNNYAKFKIRLSGFDAPEMKPKKNIIEELRIKERNAALEAKQRLENLILNKNVYLLCEDFDKYGRILATIKINLEDKESINDIMIKEHHGYVYNGGTKKVFN